MPQLRCIALYYSSIIVAISDQPTFLQMLIYQLLPSQHGNFWEKHSRIYFQGTNKYSEVQFHAFLLIFCLSQGRVSCVCLIRLLPLQFVAAVYPALIARKKIILEQSVFVRPNNSPSKRPRKLIRKKKGGIKLFFPGKKGKRGTAKYYQE